MNNTAVVLVLVLIAGAGLYLGMTTFLSQYSVVPGGSNAGQYACAPNQPTAKLNQTIQFTSSITKGTSYFWSAPDAANSSFVVSGPLTVKYARVGTKTTYLFYIVNNRWYRTACSVQVK